jgi:hypothetical protein
MKPSLDPPPMSSKSARGPTRDSTREPSDGAAAARRAWRIGAVLLVVAALLAVLVAQLWLPLRPNAAERALQQRAERGAAGTFASAPAAGAAKPPPASADDIARAKPSEPATRAALAQARDYGSLYRKLLQSEDPNAWFAAGELVHQCQSAAQTRRQDERLADCAPALGERLRALGPVYDEIERRCAGLWEQLPQSQRDGIWDSYRALLDEARRHGSLAALAETERDDGRADTRWGLFERAVRAHDLLALDTLLTELLLRDTVVGKAIDGQVYTREELLYAAEKALCAAGADCAAGSSRSLFRCSQGSIAVADCHMLPRQTVIDRQLRLSAEQAARDDPGFVAPSAARVDALAERLARALVARDPLPLRPMLDQPDAGDVELLRHEALMQQRAADESRRIAQCLRERQGPAPR